MYSCPPDLCPNLQTLSASPASSRPNPSIPQICQPSKLLRTLFKHSRTAPSGAFFPTFQPASLPTSDVFKSFRINTCKSVSKQRTYTPRNPFRINTYKKQRGRVPEFHQVTNHGARNTGHGPRSAAPETFCPGTSYSAIEAQRYT